MFEESKETQNITINKLQRMRNQDTVSAYENRKKDLQKEIMEVASSLQFNNSICKSQARPSEGEQTRLYNKFKRHLVNI